MNVNTEAGGKSVNKDQGDDVKGSINAEKTGPMAAAKPAGKVGLSFQRYFTTAGRNPMEEVEWELRDATIKGAGGEEFPEHQLWLVGRKGGDYFRRDGYGGPETPIRRILSFYSR